MIVYRLISPSNKSYIGITTRTIEPRLYEHICNWKNKRYKSKLFSAFTKYGPPKIKQLCLENRIDNCSVISSWRSGNWTIEIICHCQNIEDLNKTEKHYIQYYDSINKGYNICQGGEGTSGYKHTEEFRQKMSKVHKGVPKSEIQKKLMSENHADVSGPNHPKFGKKFPEHSKRLKGNQFAKGTHRQINYVKCPINNCNKNIDSISLWIHLKSHAGTWVSPSKGKTFKQKELECPNCFKKGGSANMKRYHFNNCKSFTN